MTPPSEATYCQFLNWVTIEIEEGLKKQDKQYSTYIVIFQMFFLLQYIVVPS